MVDLSTAMLVITRGYLVEMPMNGRQDWCCKHEHVGCASHETHDCSLGLSRRPRNHLVGGVEHVLFLHILGMSSFQLTFIFFRGVQTTNQKKSSISRPRMWPAVGHGFSPSHWDIWGDSSQRRTMVLEYQHLPYQWPSYVGIHIPAPWSIWDIACTMSFPTKRM